MSANGQDADGKYEHQCFTDTAALALWDDLYIYQGTQQGIYYEVDGVAPNRKTTFEFYLSHCCSNTGLYYHFLMTFFEARPNVVTFNYLNISDCGTSATVGVESLSGKETSRDDGGEVMANFSLCYVAGSLFLQYSLDQPIIYPGMQLTFDTSSGNGVYTVDSPGDPSQCPSGNADADGETYYRQKESSRPQRRGQ